MMDEREYLDLELRITRFDVEDVVTDSVDDIPVDSDSDMGEWFG